MEQTRLTMQRWKASTLKAVNYEGVNMSCIGKLR